MKLARLIAVTNRQKSFAKKANRPRRQQAQHERSHRHLQSARRNHKNFEGSWRGQQRRHQNADETVPLDPGVNIFRARPGVLVKHRLPALPRKVVKQQAPATEPSVAIAA